MTVPAQAMDIFEHLTGLMETKEGHPWVTLTYAQSLDGSLAARPGVPLALSGPESMAFTHRLRSQHDAILVGVGTLLADNPRLTVRLVEGRDPQPVVLDSRLRTPLEARLLSGPTRPWIAALSGADAQKRRALEAAGARVLEIPAGEDSRLSLPALLACLSAEGITSLMVEGGAQVITSFLSADLVDQVLLTIAPVFAAGLHAPHELPGGSPVRLTGVQYLQLGEDLIVCGKPERAASRTAA